MEPEDLDATRIADVPRHDRFRSIGVVASTLGTLGSSRTFEAIAAAAAAEGYATTLIPVEVVGRLDREAVDGVVVLVGDHEVNGREIELPDGVPVVVVDSRPRAGHPVVDTDQVQGAALATEHLLNLGHQTVWHIAGPMDSFAAKRREWSWRETLIRYDRDIPLAVVGDWSADSGYRLGQVLCRDPAVTAVFAANDQMALGLLRALREAGRSVPREVSVAGFDDMAEAACFWPPLTTVRQSFDELGHRAVRTLLDRIVSGSSDEVRVLVPTTLVVRGSTAPPPW